jgi:hypothetical protein
MSVGELSRRHHLQDCKQRPSSPHDMCSLSDLMILIRSQALAYFGLVLPARFHVILLTEFIEVEFKNME